MQVTISRVYVKIRYLEPLRESLANPECKLNRV